MGIETGKSVELSKEEAIKSIVNETRKELSGFDTLFDKVKNFMSDLKDDPVKALKNLFTEVKEQHPQVQANAKVEQNTAVKNETIDQNKPLGEYTDAEAKTLFTSVFGDGIVTKTFLHLTNGSGAAMMRTLALAKHEGGLDFDIKNIDPNRRSRQRNYSTFQLSAKNLDKKLAESKVGFKKLMANTPFADAKFEDTFNTLDVRQQNLALWLGHIMSRPKPYQILADLSNRDLPDAEVARLMSRRIQGGIDAIGKDVVKQTKTAKAEDYFAAMKKHGYNPTNVA